LSRVLLSEREDEIGALATRFNDMTYSLRESRAETKRQNEAKLQLEERLFQTEKLATIGQLAAEIAHEVGTPLNVIGGRARAMAKAVQKKAADPRADDAAELGAEVKKNSGIIAGEVDRIAKIIRQVLNFSRKRGPTLTRVRLAAVLAGGGEFLAETTRRQGIAVELSPPPGANDVPDVPGDPDQIQQVCL